MPKQIPEVAVVQHKRLSISIWLIPIVALLISLWLAYQYFAQLGPEITIEFESSAGLKAKQSQIKFRDVTIGTIKKISLKDGDKGVIITARINKDAQQLINENAKFWIVKPKIDKTGISGLETLVSGSYIELHSSKSDKFKKHFIGLEEPYLDEENINGKYFNLNAPNSYDIEQGSLVYCRNVEVGEVKQVKLSKNGDMVEFEIFVKDPYEKFINAQTQFFYMSNFKIDLSKSRLDMSLASSTQIIYGGIAFSTPSKQIHSYPINDDHIFPLFASEGEANTKRIGYNTKDIKTFQMRFAQNLAKLEISSPIKFDNFQIGHVVNIESSFNAEKGEMESEILADIDISVFNHDLNNSLEKGLIAQLAQSNPLLDSLYIELVYDKNNSYNIVSARPYDVFPTKSVTFEDMGAKIKTLLNSITVMIEGSQQPIQNILKNLNKTIKSTNAIISGSGLKKLPKQISKSLVEFEATLKTTRELVSSNSKMSDDISESMKEVNKASRALERVLRKIDQKPNLLIFGD
ncbi:MAG TPA: MCE family protein [Campylobacterales bacterium]|nr:MCE family protein [Campylobacterales bacterium]